MGKQRSSSRQVPWQSWEDWNWVAAELFSDSPQRISGALDRIAAWQSRGKVPISVECSATIVSIHQRDPQNRHGNSQELVLPEEMLRMMYAMVVQRLVNGVVDPSQKRNKSSIAERAELAGLPRLLVDIRHEAAHTELPGLALLRVASIQKSRREAEVMEFTLLGYKTGVLSVCGSGSKLASKALAWLKLQYWDRQRETLINAKLQLKSKLVEHCLLVVEILNPISTSADRRQSEDELESGNKSGELPAVDPQETLRDKKHQRNGLFNELLDLSLCSISNLVSTLVGDRLLEQDTPVLVDDGVYSQQQVRTVSREGADLISATDCAMKYTLRQLSSHLPRLPEMLLVALIKQINESGPRNGAERLPEDARPTVSQALDVNTDELTDSRSTSSLGRNRLISWCAWLLGKRSVQDTEDLSEKEPPRTKLLKISNSLILKVDLSKEILGEVLGLCLSASNGREPLVDLVSLIAVQLGSERFQYRATSLAHIGSRMQRAYRAIMDMSEDLEAGAMILGEERPQEGSFFEKPAAASPPAGYDSSLCSESTIESTLDVARRQQRAFLARLSSRQKDVSTSEVLLNENQSALSPLRQEGCEAQSWTVVQNWRPCAIGMIPSLCHSVGIVPSLDLRSHAHGIKQPVHKSRRGVSREGTSAATNTQLEAVDEDNSDAGGRVEPVAGKRTTDEHLEGTRGTKLGKKARHVHFEDGGPLEVDGKAVANVSRVSPKGPPIASQAFSHHNEQKYTVSLLQGCLLQQGMFMPATTQQRGESLKSAVHVL